MNISVIIPVYNSEQFISAAVNSVLQQTYQDFEIIIVDDGSTDNTGSIVKAFQDKRIKYLYQNNSGVAAARNTGITNASGDYIAFLDADDIWSKEKLKIQLKTITSNNDSGMVYTAFRIISEGNIRTVSLKNYSRQDFIKKLLSDPFKTIPYPSTVLVRKSYIDEVGYFNPELSTGEDWDLWLRLASKTECYYIDDVLVDRYSFDTSITSSLSLKRVEECHLKIINDFLTSYPDHNNLKSEAYSAIYYDLANRYFSRNNDTPNSYVYRDFLKSVIFNPKIMYKIATEIQNDPELVQESPLRAPVSRVDETLAARQPNLRWQDK